MKLDLRTLKVKRGDKIQPVVESLIKELPDLLKPFTTSGNVRFMETPHGVNVVVDDDSPVFTPRFRVSASAQFARVGVGYVNAEYLPTIKGVPLDGRLPNGKVVDVPQLKLTAPASRRSWICLQVTMTKGKIDLEADKDSVTVLATDTLKPPSTEVGWHPLALIRWNDSGGVYKVEQIAMHNVKHIYRPAVPGFSSAAHFFAAV